MMQLLVDGKGLAFRLWYANTHGLVPRFANSVRKAAEMCKATETIVAWEGGRTWRHDLFPAYKSHRKQTPTSLTRQFPDVIRGHRVAQVEGFEADDVLATLAARATGRVAILTNDKDALQALRPGVCVVRPWETAFWFGLDWFRYEWGIEPSQVPDVLALAGDASDGFPGIRGIGLEGAKQMVREAGGIAQILAGEGRGTKYDRVRANRHEAELYLKLATLRTDVPITQEVSA